MAPRFRWRPLIAAMALLVASAPAQRAADRVVGLWHRPVADPASREAMWQRCETAGVTDLFVQTFYHGFTIYPSNAERTFEQRPSLQGRDLLGEYIEEGHRRGIRIHAWLDTLLWGPDWERHPHIPRNQFAEHHHWRVLDHAGRTPRPFYVSPAIPEVADRVQILCLEILHFHPELDGILLDQFRYPGGGDFTHDSPALSEFVHLGHPDPRDNPSEQTAAAWREFIEGKLTQLIAQIHLLMHGIHGDQITVSAMVFPDAAENPSSDLKYQRWPAWIAAHSLDAVIPMCFETDLDRIRAQAALSAEIAAQSDTPCWVGLAWRPESDRPPLTEQLQALETLPVQGVVIFSEGWLAEDHESFERLGDWAPQRDSHRSE